MSDSPFVPEAGSPIEASARDDTTLMALAQSQSPSPNGTCDHEIAGQALVTDPDGVLYWPATATLVVADLHLEKGSSFARRGLMLPPYDTQMTLEKLARCINRWQPKRVIALGDSFHDAKASERLSLPSLTLLKSLMAGRDWVWITGNHDPEPPVGLGGDVADDMREAGLIFRHEPQREDCEGELAGHLHPKARIIMRGRSIRRSCFAASKTRMILPSFGAYTGGLDVLHRAYEGLFDARNFHALMRGDGQVYRIAGVELC